MFLFRFLQTHLWIRVNKSCKPAQAEFCPSNTVIGLSLIKPVSERHRKFSMPIAFIINGSSCFVTNPACNNWRFNWLFVIPKAATTSLLRSKAFGIQWVKSVLQQVQRNKSFGFKRTNDWEISYTIEGNSITQLFDIYGLYLNLI